MKEFTEQDWKLYLRYRDYNQEKDRLGYIGRSIADQVSKRFQGCPDEFKKWLILGRALYLPKVLEREAVLAED
jgi:hypothetical protein